MSTTRRAILLGSAGLATAVAIPGVQYAAWSMKDFTRDGYNPGLPPAPDGEVAWSNWSGIQQSTPKQIAVPATEDELATAITGAQRVRPVGSGHSFTGLVPSEHLIVDASRFSGLVSSDAATGIVTIGAGTRIRQAARELDAAGLACRICRTSMCRHWLAPSPHQRTARAVRCSRCTRMSKASGS